MTDAELVLRKLSILKQHLERARRRRPDDLQDFVADVDRQDALAMSLLVAIQEAIDIATHIASDDGLGLPASYAEAFELLAEHGVIERELAATMVQAAGLRNRLAHGYGSVDAKRLWHELPEGFSALEHYVRAVASYAGD